MRPSEPGEHSAGLEDRVLLLEGSPCLMINADDLELIPHTSAVDYYNPGMSDPALPAVPVVEDERSDKVAREPAIKLPYTQNAQVPATRASPRPFPGGRDAASGPSPQAKAHLRVLGILRRRLG